MTTEQEEKARADYLKLLQDKHNAEEALRRVRHIAWQMRAEAFNNTKVHRYATIIIEVTKEWADNR